MGGTHAQAEGGPGGGRRCGRARGRLGVEPGDARPRGHLLPSAHLDVPQEEIAALDGFRRALDGLTIADTPGERMDARMLRAALTHLEASAPPPLLTPGQALVDTGRS